jgi:hypothetical protein
VAGPAENPIQHPLNMNNLQLFHVCFLSFRSPAGGKEMKWVKKNGFLEGEIQELGDIEK